jgi:hypothetical protein
MEFSIMPFDIQTDSPQPLPQSQEDNGFAQAAFDELQHAYVKDPANVARMYRDLKSDADNAFFNAEVQADSYQKLCLLDLAVANIKAKTGDHQSASVMYNDAALSLYKLKSLPGRPITQAISDISGQVRCKI